MYCGAPLISSQQSYFVNIPNEVCHMTERALISSLDKATIRKSRFTDGRFVAISIIAMVSVFALLIVFVNGGGVRHVLIFWKENIEASVAFRNVNGELKVGGINGITQVNPTLVSRTGDTAYILTVINQDTTPQLANAPESRAGANERAGFIDAPDIRAKKKISRPIIPPIATPLKPFNPLV
jgi:hypothetical protein